MTVPPPMPIMEERIPTPTAKIEIVIEEDKQELKIGTDIYIFYQASGHNEDGLICFNKSKQLLIAGDYLSNIEFPYVYKSIAEYSATLEIFNKIILNNTIRILIPGHGDYTADRKEMLLRVEESKKYFTELKGLLKGQKFNLEALFKRYKFSLSMRSFHNENISLLKKEFSSGNP